MNRIHIGDKFGDWEVISKGQNKGPKGIFSFWVCRCKCGFEKIFKTSYLNTGQATCCENCRNKKKELINDLLQKDIIGKRYGSYTVIKYLGKNKHNSRIWLCRCSCGKEREFLSSYLYGNGERRATLCQVCYNEKLELEKRVTDHIPNRFWSRFLDHSKRRKITVFISKEEAFEQYKKQNKKCALSGEFLFFTEFRSNFTRYTNASIDRINSDLPYSIDNIQWVHKKVNIMKHMSSDNEFIGWCEKIVTWNKSVA